MFPYLSLNVSFLAHCLSPGRPLLIVVYTEDIKWPAFTEMLESLLHAEVLLFQQLRREIRRYQQQGGVMRTADK